MSVPKRHQWWTKISFTNSNDQSDDDDDEFICNEMVHVTKSLSTPSFNFNSSNRIKAKTIERSKSNYNSSNVGSMHSCSSGTIRRTMLEQMIEESLRRKHEKLDDQTQQRLNEAKESAQMQMVVEKQRKIKKSTSANIEELIGISFERKKLTRRILAKLSTSQLILIDNQLQDEIECLNEELMTQLIERDNLFDEQDSLHTKIESLLQH